MGKHKKILSTVLKILIGLGSVWIVYYRLQKDINPQSLQLMSDSIFNSSGFLYLILCVALIPVNWGIESYKWMLITRPVESISFKTAGKSVYSGVCVGNLAPGRATEFLAKIIFFQPQNRTQVTVLHFINGMFQLSVTYLLGFISLSFKAQSFGSDYDWVARLAFVVAVCIILLFILSIFKVQSVLRFAAKRFVKNEEQTEISYRFTPKLIFSLFGFSVLRYFVFFLQMMLLLNLFSGHNFDVEVMLGVALYFLITTTIPMISVVEAAIRAAVALVVFKDSGISTPALALCSVLIWLINIIIPSIAGYFILLRQDFDFKLSRIKK